MTDINQFRNNIINGEILDPVGVHHEFASGAHGRKLDFEQLDDELFNAWVEINADALRSFGSNVIAVIGIANGTSDLAASVARRLKIEYLGTYKNQTGKVLLTGMALNWISNAGRSTKAEIVALEDVGTTGGSALNVVRQVIEHRGPLHGKQEISCLVTWQRTETLEALDLAGIKYSSIIRELLDTYSLEECQEMGYCAEGWELIKRN